jgi:hypothetical protein
MRTNSRIIFFSTDKQVFGKAELILTKDMVSNGQDFLGLSFFQIGRVTLAANGK